MKLVYLIEFIFSYVDGALDGRQELQEKLQ